MADQEGRQIRIDVGLADSEPTALLRRFAPKIRGQINGFPFQATSEIDEQGNFTITVPRGLTDAVIVLNSRAAISPASRVSAAAAVASRQAQPQWRIDQDKPLVTGEEIPLGKIDAQIHGIEIVYPDPPQPTSPAPPRPPRGAGAGS